jgi:hypothetical protein
MAVLSPAVCHGRPGAINTTEVHTWVLLARVQSSAQEQVAELVRVAEQEQVAGQEAVPRGPAVPVGLAAPAAPLAPAEEVLGGQAPRERGPEAWERAPQLREPRTGPWVPERPARVIRARSAAAVAPAAPVSLCGLAAQDSSPAELDCPGEAPSPRGPEAPQGRVESLVPVRLAAPRRDSANQPSAGSHRSPPKDRGHFPAPCCLVRA